MHWDRHSSAMNFTLILAIVVAVIGALSALPLLVVGLIVAAFSWLTTPSQYAVFSDRLIIYYGKPRVRHVLFQRIEQVELLSLPIGSRLRVRLEGGRMLFIQPRDAEEFQSKFQVALDSFRGDRTVELQRQGDAAPIECPTCGVENSPGAGYCTSCGVPLPAPGGQSEVEQSVVYCNGCGTENADTATACANCGEPLQAPPERDASSGQDSPTRRDHPEELRGREG